MEIKTIGDVKVAVMVPRFDSHTAAEVEIAGLTCFLRFMILWDRH